MQLELSTCQDVYARLSESGTNNAAAKLLIRELAQQLAGRVRQVVQESIGARTVECVVVLRGGLLLYPAFSECFLDARVTVVAARRSSNGRVIEYDSGIPNTPVDLCLYLDSVVGTGLTLGRVHSHLGARRSARRSLACVLSSSSLGAERLAQMHIDMVGFSLNESVDSNGLVRPDLGTRDAGDLVAGVFPESHRHLFGAEDA